MQTSITVLYTCNKCGLTDQPVTVPQRQSETDVAAWVKGFALLCAWDHSKLSPHCHPETFTNIKIPIPDGTQYIGGPVEH